ncbi:MAG: tRNA guanosine(34) transglycosylase Tgt [Dehalococcoidia bacterium]|nr:tRNA guanosine(34) transglycosylase Tgt [Dehalococcoidia bacterium]
MSIFSLLHEDATSGARRGRLTLGHGTVETPAFMPVATHGSVKGLTPVLIRETGAEMILANAYHLWLRPGCDVVDAIGGLHRFCGWDGPILTDSGGYQIFSLAALARVTDDGVTFRSHLDGSTHSLTVEDVVRSQERLGSDIAMVLDHCPPGDADRSTVTAATERTARWAARAAAARVRSDQAMFGIVQGGTHLDLREQSAVAVVGLGFDGYALGGLSVGEPRPDTWRVAAATVPHLPVDQPRYFMGAGMPADLLRLVAAGVDMFDCVLPTRLARNGTLFTTVGPLVIRHACYTADPRPVDETCDCYTCRHFSRAYLRHLVMAREPLAVTLNTIHNITYYERLMLRMREAIATDTFAAFVAAQESAGSGAKGEGAWTA